MNKNNYTPNGPQGEAGNNAGNNTDADRINRWRWMLDQHVPIIGNWMHRKVTTALTESALAGNWLATQSLAVVHAFHEDAEVRRLAGQTLRKINYVTGIDAVWGIWAETRHSGLQEIAVSYNRPASHPSSVRLLSALCLNLQKVITHGGSDLVPALIQSLDDRDPKIIERAREVILNLHSQDSIDAVCSAWLDSRYSFLGEVILEAGYVAQKPPAVQTSGCELLAGQ